MGGPQVDAFVWLTDDRRDGDGRLWPDASLDGFWVNEAEVLRSDTLLTHGIGPKLWSVEFDGEAFPSAEGYGGKARLYAEIAGWSIGTAGELRLQLFQAMRASLSRALVAADDESGPDPFERDVILDMVQAGRKISGARGPSELKPVLPTLGQLVSRLWPPDKKRGMFAKKVDTARAYENMRSAMESALEAANEAVEGTLDMDAVHGVNRMLRVLGKLIRAEATFVEMMKIQGLADQEKIDAELDAARGRIRAIRDVDVREPGAELQEGGSGSDSLGIASPFLQQQVGLTPQVAPQTAAVLAAEYPKVFVESAAWLQNRLQIAAKTG